MSISRATRNNILITALFTFLGIVVGALFSVLMGRWWLSFSLIYGGTLGGTIAGLVTAVEFFVAEVYLDRGPMRLPFWQAFVLRTTVYGLIVILCIWLITGWVFNIPGTFEDPDLGKAVLFSLAAIAMGNVMLGVARLIGFRNLFRYVLGRYYNPHQEWRILMFLDIAGSTTLAEEIGDVRFHALLTDVFERLSYVVDEHGGEVHDYVGDEMIATWPVRSNSANANAVLCAFACFDSISRRAEAFQRRHGMVPTFRIGMHLGSIVAGAVGGMKQTIVYVGDAMNTASRIEQACREEGRDFLISEEVMNAVDVPSAVQVEKLGMRRLRGRSLPVELFSLTRKSG
ncbi:MAG TPA: hypothetical protein DCW68_05770 [Rhodospirillaceae bacterium]|nr:MAG: hypothetical protein A2018_01890 [Alphaproteobacteria bacterium GWF2_58_20]HAU29601.1 hypothetical protein [Rhodospirillaceae bacterium]